MSDSDQAQFIQEYQYADSSEGLLFYDTAIAFSQEYQVVWSRRVTGASAIYIALRYSNMMSAVVTLAELATPSCASLYILNLVLIGAVCLVYLSQSAFAAIRVYAIQGGAWATAAVVMALGLVPVATNIYGASQTMPADTLLSCWSSKTSATESNKRIGSDIPHILALQRWISSVILCRFFLNLRQAANSNDDLMTSSDRTFSGITSRIIGNMGEMLEEDSLESDTLVGTYYGTELDDGDLLPSDNTREMLFNRSKGTLAATYQLVSEMTTTRSYSSSVATNSNSEGQTLDYLHGKRSQDHDQLALDPSNVPIRDYTLMLSASEPTTAEGPFNEPDADVVLRTSDMVDFYVHVVILRIASPFFKDMFSLPQPRSGGLDAPEIIPVAEDSKTLDCLLRMSYPIEEPLLTDLGLVGSVLEAAMKYQMDTSVKKLRRMLSAFSNPLRVYTIACTCRLEKEAQLAAQEWVEDQQSAVTDYIDEMDSIPAGSYFRLLHFHSASRAGKAVPEGYCFCSPAAAAAPEAADVVTTAFVIPPPFDVPASPTHVIVRCLDADFYADRGVLLLSSPKLKAMLNDPELKSEGDRSVISLRERQEVLLILLQLTYPGTLPELDDWHMLTAVVEAAGRLEMTRAAELAKKQWISQIEAHPHPSYFVATRNGWDELAHAAAKHALLISADEYVPEMESVDARTYRQFLLYRQRCRALVTVARRQIVADRNVGKQEAYDVFFDERERDMSLDYTLHRAWALCGAASEPMDPPRQSASAANAPAAGLGGAWPAIVAQLFSVRSCHSGEMLDIIYSCEEHGGGAVAAIDQMPVPGATMQPASCEGHALNIIIYATHAATMENGWMRGKFSDLAPHGSVESLFPPVAYTLDHQPPRQPVQPLAYDDDNVQIPAHKRPAEEEVSQPIHRTLRDNNYGIHPWATYKDITRAPPAEWPREPSPPVLPANTAGQGTASRISVTAKHRQAAIADVPQPVAGSSNSVPGAATAGRSSVGKRCSCVFCGSSFASYSNRREHVAAHCRSDERGPFYCPSCWAEFPNVNLVVKHGVVHGLSPMQMARSQYFMSISWVPNYQPEKGVSIKQPAPIELYEALGSLYSRDPIHCLNDIVLSVFQPAKTKCRRAQRPPHLLPSPAPMQTSFYGRPMASTFIFTSLCLV
ncbi:hypothetical protein IEO21_06595 [Rhodonia placenta]|uniref:BTB domain-containing protein n=1 Tax=Rhodonia placenta TaxID=104341 RepID=A0A8H7U153_9APHY|nr:hypothetical protein IEO21_06595 [Postia placenta]